MEDKDFEACPPQGLHQNKVDEEDAMDDEVNKVVTPRVRRLREAIDHTRHFVSMSKQPRWQITAMDIVARCAAQLQMERYTNAVIFKNSELFIYEFCCCLFRIREELLPLLHQCWQPLKLLFDSSNLFVLEKAFGVVLVFARCAGDFVASRTVKDVLPPMLNSTRKLQVNQ